MEPTTRRTEIFAPFGEAFDLTKKILFRPFDLVKWLVIGFAAWLATFFGGGGFNYNRLRDWKRTGHHVAMPTLVHDASGWPVLMTVLLFLCALAFVILFLWLNARGRFIFTDCIVRNRSAIVEPWREYRMEANSFFLFQLGVIFAVFLIFACVALFYFLAFHFGNRPLTIALLVVLVLVWLPIFLLFNMITHFMVAVMYRRRCGAMEAFRAVWSLFLANLGVFVLFELFIILLAVAAVMISCLAGCVTCCLAMLPYVGTVILLPVVMVLFAFPLRFLRQFGDSYDVWAGADPAELPPPQIPPAAVT